MPITEGQNAAAAPAINETALANAFTESLKRSGLVVAPQHTGAAAESDPFREAMKEVGATVEGGEQSLDGVRKLFEAFGKTLEGKMTAKQRQETQAQLVELRNTATVDFIDMALDEYIGNDDFLIKRKESLRGEVINEFMNDSKHAEAYRKYIEQGIADKALLKKVALSKVNEWNESRGLDKKVKGPTGLNRNDAAGDGKLPSGSGDESTYTEDPKTMQGRERDLYYAKLATAQRAGMGANSKEAKEFAMRGVTKFREGKRKAKEVLGSKLYHRD